MSFSKLLCNTLFFGIAITCFLVCLSLLSCCAYGFDSDSLALVSLLKCWPHHQLVVDFSPCLGYRYNPSPQRATDLVGYPFRLDLSQSCCRCYWSCFGPLDCRQTPSFFKCYPHVGTLLCWMMVGLGWQHLSHKTESTKKRCATAATKKSKSWTSVPLGQDKKSDLFSLQAAQQYVVDAQGATKRMHLAPLGQDKKSDLFSLQASPTIRRKMRNRRNKKRMHLASLLARM